MLILFFFVSVTFCALSPEIQRLLSPPPVLLSNEPMKPTPRNSYHLSKTVAGSIYGKVMSVRYSTLYYIHQYEGRIPIRPLLSKVESTTLTPTTTFNNEYYNYAGNFDVFDDGSIEYDVINDEVAWTDDETLFLLLSIEHQNEVNENSYSNILSNPDIKVSYGDREVKFDPQRTARSLYLRHKELVDDCWEDEETMGVLWTWKMDCQMAKKVLQILLSRKYISNDDLLNELWKDEEFKYIFRFKTKDVIKRRLFIVKDTIIGDLHRYLIDRYSFNT